MTDAVAAIRETAAELLDWAKSDANIGPCAQEAYRTNIHIVAALAKLAAKLEAASLALDSATLGDGL